MAKAQYSASLRLAAAIESGNLLQVQAALADVDVTKSQHPDAEPWLVAHFLINTREPCLVPVAELLMASGADPNSRNQKGQSCLALAISHRKLDFCKALLKAGADPDDLDHDGWSSLMRLYVRPATGAFLTGVQDEDATAIAKVLLAAGADPNLTGFTGVNTALMLAADRRWPKLCQLLIQHGAKVDVRDSAKRRPLDRAKKAGCMDCVAIIEQAELSVDAHTDLQVETPLVSTAPRRGGRL